MKIVEWLPQNGNGQKQTERTWNGNNKVKNGEVRQEAETVVKNGK